MPTNKTPLEITLEFTRKENAADPYAFSFVRQEYHIRSTGGPLKAASFNWDDTDLKQALLELERAGPCPVVLERLGLHLRRFLDTTGWSREEAEIERALQQQRQIDITICSDAAELYSLPWELLALESSRMALCDLEGCLIRYQWPQRATSDALSPPPTPGRLLFAYSGAGGRVPWKEHLEVIENACKEAGLKFDLEYDVLRNVTRRSLHEALRDTTRPVSVLHLLCHGSPTPQESYGLVLDATDPDMERDIVNAAEFQGLLPSSGMPLRLITLCACHSGDAGRPAHLLGGIAQRLHLHGVPAVIASRMPLSVPGSTEYTRALYQELLTGEKSLRKAMSAARTRLKLRPRSTDWASLQLYARKGDEAALYPFSHPPALHAAPEAPRPDLILIRHEAYAKAVASLMPADDPSLFSGRRIRKELSLKQMSAFQGLDELEMDAEVKRLASDEGELKSILEESNVELVYYGFPFVPLAALVGYMAKTHPVHLYDYDREAQRFTWRQGGSGPYPPLELQEQRRRSGNAAQLRLSLSAPVNLEDCEQVLDKRQVRLDLLVGISSHGRGVITQREQMQAYVRQLRQVLDQKIPATRGLESLHVFAAVPVSIAFSLGQILAATWLRNCYVYNFDINQTPRYKWRLQLAAAAKGGSIKVFNTR